MTADRARVAEAAYGKTPRRRASTLDARLHARLVDIATRLRDGIEGAQRAAGRFEAPLRARVDAGSTRAGELGEELRTLGATEVSLRQELDEASGALTAAEVEIARIDAEASDATRRLQSAGDVEPAEGDDRDELATRVQRSRRRRVTLGQVNPLAREEYEAEKERLTDLKTQREDLERSLEELDALCAELTATVERRFAATFEAVAEHFEEVASTLFPGGEGRLRLVDPEDEGGEPGIEVELRPAGKRITRLSLLSGGEKALGAISFLFALFLARPCAFYLLDEVEAALDDTNIARFVELLRRYADRAQFVVVTHQKRTMEAADILYGVTMGPDGVSQVVSRRLPQHQQALAATAREQRPPSPGNRGCPVSRTWSELLGDAPTEADEPERTGFFGRMRESLAKSRRALTAELASAAFDSSDDEAWERLEEALIRSDVGVPATAEIVRRLEARGVTGSLGESLVEEVEALFGEPPTLALDAKPSVILVVGVNGTGKTTTIGKLARKLSEHGRSVLVGAADTFRAAAEEQLEIWAERAGADFVGAPRGADPAAVAFDTVEAARARGRDVAIVDTAGRLHTQSNLMTELEKVRRVIGGRLDGAPHETLLVVDATTGQNGLQQARLFGDAAGVTGVALTKLDGSARGGVAIAIAVELGLPVKLVGVGEGRRRPSSVRRRRLRPSADRQLTPSSRRHGGPDANAFRGHARSREIHSIEGCARCMRPNARVRLARTLNATQGRRTGNGCRDVHALAGGDIRPVRRHHGQAGPRCKPACRRCAARGDCDRRGCRGV